MTYKLNRVGDMWTATMADRVGALAAKLAPLVDAGVDLEIIIARRQPGPPGEGVVFLGPIRGAKAVKAARSAGLAKAPNLVAFRVEGRNRPGECHRIIRLLAEAGINLRGLAASKVRKHFVVSLGFDSDADADRAAKLLRRRRARKTGARKNRASPRKAKSSVKELP